MKRRKTPAKNRRIKIPAAGRGAAWVKTAAPCESSMFPNLSKQERDVLRYSAELKKLGVAPDALLLEQLTAEKAVRQAVPPPRLHDRVPDLLRLLVGVGAGAPLLPLQIDALDSPSVREQLKSARTNRKLFTRQPLGDDRVDLEACADALCLKRSRGGQLKPDFDRLMDTSHYAIYLLLQSMIADLTGAIASNARFMEFLVENPQVLLALNEFFGGRQDVGGVPVKAALGIRQSDAKKFQSSVVTAAKRQADSLKADKSLPGAHPPAARCALALLEVLTETPAQEAFLPEALKYIDRLQRSLQLVKARTKRLTRQVP